MKQNIATEVKTDLIEINLRWFSVLAEKRGKRTESIKVKPGTTGSNLIKSLASDFDMLAKYKNHVRLAVNREYVEPDKVLSDGDEVAFITPVSGG